jgi:hypothetical protein
MMVLGACAVLILVLGIVLLWRHHKNADPLAGLKPGTYQSAGNAAGDTLPVPPPRQTR